MTIIVAATSAALADKFEIFQKVGGIIGVSVSCSCLPLKHTNNSFLFVIALANIFVLISQIKTYRLLRAQKLIPLEQRVTNDDVLNQMGGKMMRIFNKLFKFIDRPWKMYPLGFLFGLGFDTSTEIALLGIASVEATKGTSFWLLLLFPLVFTCGMCLIGASTCNKIDNRYHGWSIDEFTLCLWFPKVKTKSYSIISFDFINHIVDWNCRYHWSDTTIISDL
jgi:nickel/cobalt transporter (NiCoT) family protein